MYSHWSKKIFVDGKPVSLTSKIQELEEKLLERCAGRKKICALFCKNNLNFICSYYTLFKNDIIPLILKYFPSQEELKGLDAHFFLTDESETINLIPLSRDHRYEGIQNCQVILQTSGSTGDPKHVGWSPNGIDYQSMATSKILEYGKNDCLAIMMPLYTAYSLSLIHIAFYQNLPLCVSNSGDPEHFLKTMVCANATTLDALPETYIHLLKFLKTNPHIKKQLSTVRAWNCGGDLLEQNLALEWQKFMNMPLLDGYGLSEAGPNVAINGPRQFKFGTVGKPLSGTLLRLSEEGELLVKSPSVMRKYLRGHHLTVSAEGWLHTGDIAIIDAQGFLKILGRK